MDSYSIVSTPAVSASLLQVVPRSGAPILLVDHRGQRVTDRCAGRERFFSFLSGLYDSQESWSHAKDPQAALARIAKLGGMGDEKFKACMDDKALVDRIVASRFEAEKTYGVKSMPTFIVNGQKIAGAVPYPEFARALEAAHTRG